MSTLTCEQSLVRTTVMAAVTGRQTVLLRSRQLTAPVDVQHHWMIQTTPAIDQTTK